MKQILTILITLFALTTWADPSDVGQDPMGGGDLSMLALADLVTRVTALENAPPPPSGLRKIVDANGSIVGTLFRSTSKVFQITVSNLYWEVMLKLPGTPRRMIVHPNYLASIDPRKTGSIAFDQDNCTGAAIMLDGVSAPRLIPDAVFDESYNTMAISNGTMVTVYDVPDQSGLTSVWAPESMRDLNGNCSDATPAPSMPMYYLNSPGSILATFTLPFSVQ